MEVGGAAFGLPPVDLGRVLKRLAVVGPKGQVAGQRRPGAGQAAGQVGGQGPVQPPLQLLVVGEGSEQGAADGLGGGGGQPLGGGEHRGQPGSGQEHHRQEDRRRAAAAGLRQAQVGEQPVGGEAVNVLAGEGILGVAHGSLR